MNPDLALIKVLEAIEENDRDNAQWWLKQVFDCASEGYAPQYTAPAIETIREWVRDNEHD